MDDDGQTTTDDDGRTYKSSIGHQLALLRVRKFARPSAGSFARPWQEEKIASQFLKMAAAAARGQGMA